MFIKPMLHMASLVIECEKRLFILKESTVLIFDFYSKIANCFQSLDHVICLKDFWVLEVFIS